MYSDGASGGGGASGGMFYFGASNGGAYGDSSGGMFYDGVSGGSNASGGGSDRGPWEPVGIVPSPVHWDAGLDAWVPDAALTQAVGSASAPDVVTPPSAPVPPPTDVRKPDYYDLMAALGLGQAPTGVQPVPDFPAQPADKLGLYVPATDLDFWYGAAGLGKVASREADPPFGRTNPSGNGTRPSAGGSSARRGPTSNRISIR